MLNFRATYGRHLTLGCALLILMCFAAVQALAKSAKKGQEFASLQERLIRDGFDPGRIKALYRRPAVYFETRGVSLFLMHSEATLNYDQFISRKAIRSAQAYMDKYQKELANAETLYGVDGEVITAILLVETRLGTVKGRRSVLNSLSTMASLADPVVRDMLWNQVSAKSRLSRPDYEKWVARRSAWAYTELKAFLEYTTREKIDPSNVHGSYAGAMGFAQFMPSNILAHAKDGNADGRIDLFNHADAISSIASYLKHYGWHPGIDNTKAYDVIYHYNHSKYYVKTVIKIKDRLKG